MSITVFYDNCSMLVKMENESHVKCSTIRDYFNNDMSYKGILKSD